MTSFNINMSRKDLINAKNASISVADAINSGEEYIVSGVALVEDGGTSKTGEKCDVGYIATNAGVFGFTSNVLINGLQDLADYLKETLDSGEIIKIRFNENKTVKGTTFYNFTII